MHGSTSHDQEHMHADGSVHTQAHSHADSSVHGHAHTHAGGTAHTHQHDHTEDPAHTHDHGHTHDPKEMQKIINRLSRSIGHLESVKRMIEDGKDCSDVLIQLAAVRSEINGAGKALLKEHLEHCIVEAVAEQDEESIRHMNEAIDRFIK